MAQSPRSFPQGFIMPHLPHRGEQARAPRRICRPQEANRLRHFVPHFLPHGQKTGPQYPNRRKILHPVPACFLPYRQKTGASVADFRVRRREIILIVFSDDRRRIAAKRQEKPPWGVCVRKNTFQPASVEFAHLGGQIMRAAGCIPQNKRNRPIGTVPFILSLFYS